MEARRKEWWLRGAKVPVFLLCLVPVGLLVWQAVTGSLGANPVEALIHATGDWTLRFLLLTLAMTPLRRITGWSWPIRFRRMLGLFTFFYAVLHFTAYVGIDQRFDWAEILEDVLKRPYITIGFAALVLLIPLALTSTRGFQRRLGARWKRLHRLVYLIAILGVLHYLWLVKADLLEPLIYGAILLVLFALRVPWRKRSSAGPEHSSPLARRNL